MGSWVGGELLVLKVLSGTVFGVGGWTRWAFKGVSPALPLVTLLGW